MYISSIHILTLYSTSDKDIRSKSSKNIFYPKPRTEALSKSFINLFKKNHERINLTASERRLAPVTSPKCKRERERQSYTLTLRLPQYN